MKITQEQQREGQEIYQKLVARAWQSTSFKEELIENPKTAIENFTKEKLVLPEDTRIIVEDQTDSSRVYLNIPRKVDINNFELTDEQLELVAGGEWAIVIGIAIIAVVGFTDGIKDMK